MTVSQPTPNRGEKEGTNRLQNRLPLESNTHKHTGFNDLALTYLANDMAVLLSSCLTALMSKLVRHSNVVLEPMATGGCI